MILQEIKFKQMEFLVDDLLLLIFDNLDLFSLNGSRLVSSRWNKLIKQNYLDQELIDSLCKVKLPQIDKLKISLNVAGFMILYYLRYQEWFSIKRKHKLTIVYLTKYIK